VLAASVATNMQLRDFANGGNFMRESPVVVVLMNDPVL